MEAFADIPLIGTIKERCRVCYTCVRECPAKAIRIKGGQAAVIEERCIGCGKCVRVCSQRAKQFRRCTDTVRRLLAGGGPVAACLAPSFPAEFDEVPAPRLVGMLRRLGFSSVHQVAFGADLVAERYRQLLEADPGGRFIATTCPAVVGYVERYHPGLLPSLAPIVSPMVAMARCLRELHGPELKVVFIGPCVAKKREALGGDLDAALTFAELRDMFAEDGLTAQGVEPAAFDPPQPRRGTLFALSRGLLETAGLDQSLLSGVVAAHGHDVAEALDDFESGAFAPGLLEALACRGCVAGPGMSGGSSRIALRNAVASFARRELEAFDEPAWRAQVDRFSGLSLERGFTACDQRLPEPSAEQLAEIMARMGKRHGGDELNCGSCGYETCREHARAIHRGLAECEMCLPYTIDQLRRAVADLADTREALMHAETLASMGQLAAGIAHEVNNPLGVVLMYAHLLLDEFPPESRARDDLKMIAEQADRCKRIVAGLLNFARQNKVILQPVDLREVADAAVRALQPPVGIGVRTAHEGDPGAELDRDQMAQVLTNLISNSYDAMPAGGQLTVATGGDEERVWFKVSDTGVGIPPQNLAKVFEPFFTTKPIGKGTGLGLAVTYGIVKMHRGDIKVESNVDPDKGPTGTSFTVILPRHPREE